jgi:hypothetical protein
LTTDLARLLTAALQAAAEQMEAQNAAALASLSAQLAKVEG